MKQFFKHIIGGKSKIGQGRLKLLLLGEHKGRCSKVQILGGGGKVSRVFRKGGKGQHRDFVSLLKSGTIRAEDPV